MLLHSTRLGDIEVAEEQIFRFPHGLPGFAHEKAFALLPYEPDSPFFLLQSTTNPDLTFELVDPFTYFKDYSFELPDEMAQELGLSDENPPLIFCIVTVRGELAQMTANLKAPLVINTQTRTALQLVLDGTSYTMRERLFPPTQTEKGGE